jgi:hypothetical protein
LDRHYQTAQHKYNAQSLRRGETVKEEIFRCDLCSYFSFTMAVRLVSILFELSSK